MDSTREGYDYIQIHRNRLGYDESIALNEHQWIKIAAALADDLALTIKGLASYKDVIDALGCERNALLDAENLCNRDNCGYINEYKAKLDQRVEQVEALVHLIENIGDKTEQEIHRIVWRILNK